MDPWPGPSTSITSVLVPAKWPLMASSSRRIVSPARNLLRRLVFTCTWSPNHPNTSTSAPTAASKPVRRCDASRPAQASSGSNSGWWAAWRRRSRAGGAGSHERTTGMMVSSITSADAIPRPAKSPNVRMEAVWNVTSDQNDSVATSPAPTITGPTWLMQATIASSTSAVFSYSS